MSAAPGMTPKLARPSRWARLGPLRDRKVRTAYLFLLPVIVWFVLFQFLPMLYGLLLSFLNYKLIGQSEFIGLANYVEAFTRDPTWWKSVLTTAKFVVVAIPLSVAGGLAIAMLLNTRVRGLPVFRLAYFAPVVTSVVAVSLVWKFMYQPTFGPLNPMLAALGLPSQSFMNDVQLAIVWIAVMSVWKNLGFYMVIFLAGLQGIPQEYYEAAWIDGAHRSQTFRHITLPLLTPTILFVMVVGMIGAVQIFSEVYLMTSYGGGPLNAARTMVYHIQTMSMKYLRFGYGSSLSLLLLGMIMVLTLIQFKLLGKDIDY